MTKISNSHGGLSSFYTLDSGDGFGSSVAPLGDLNGDGVLDYNEFVAAMTRHSQPQRTVMAQPVIPMAVAQCGESDEVLQAEARAREAEQRAREAEAALRVMEAETRARAAEQAMSLQARHAALEHVARRAHKHFRQAPMMDLKVCLECRLVLWENLYM